MRHNLCYPLWTGFVLYIVNILSLVCHLEIKYNWRFYWPDHNRIQLSYAVSETEPHTLVED